MAIDLAVATRIVRTLAPFASSKTDAEVQQVITEQGVARTKLWLLTATDSTGQQVFYTALSDLADQAASDQAEQLVDLVFNEPIISNSLCRVAASFAATWLLYNTVGILESQQKLADKIEKAALADLTQLIRSKTVSKAIENALPRLNVLTSDSVYLAVDYDKATVDLEKQTAKPISGAREVGRITAIINGLPVQAEVKVGDVPAVIVDKLAKAIMAAQAAGNINLSAAPAEGYVASGTRTHSYLDGAGVELSTSVTYSTNLAVLGFKPFKLDNTVDMAVATVYLSHPDPANQGQHLPGIDGLIYGTVRSVDRLTKCGPYSVVVDLNKGVVQAVNNNAAADQSALVSDSFFFEVKEGGTTAEGSVKYRINDGALQTVAIPIASDAQTVVTKLAEDLAAKASTQLLLGAVRPSSRVTVNGTPKNAPGLELIAHQASSKLAKLVFHVAEVPPGCAFGVVPATLVTQDNFDASPKAVVVECVMRTAASMSKDEVVAIGKPEIKVTTAAAKPSAALQKILDKWVV